MAHQFRRQSGLGRQRLGSYHLARPCDVGRCQMAPSLSLRLVQFLASRQIRHDWHPAPSWQFGPPYHLENRGNVPSVAYLQVYQTFQSPRVIGHRLQQRWQFHGVPFQCLLRLVVRC